MSEDQPRKTSLCLYFVDDVDQPGSCGDCKRPKEAHACSTRTTAYHSAVPFSPFTTRKRTTELASNPHMREIQPADSTGRASPGADSASGDEFLPSIESDAFMSTRQAASLRTKFITEMCDVTRRRPHLPSLSTIGKGDSSEDQNSELGTEGGNGRANSGSELGLNSEVDPESRVSGKGSQEDLSAEITINGCIEEVLLRFQAMLHWEGEVSHHRGLVYDFFVCYDLYISPESLMDKICYEVFYDFGTMSFLKMYSASDNDIFSHALSAEGAAAEDTQPDNSHSGSQRVLHTDLKQETARDVACLFLQHWYEIRPMDWERPEVKALWNKFLGDVKEPHDPRLPACLAEVEDLRNMAYGFDIKVVNRKVLAEQFCILLFDDVASVSLAEFASKGWLKRHRHQEQAPGILRVLRRHNSVCLFAASLVLDSKPGQERFQCVVQLLRLALWLKKKGCYDTVFALHDGLHSPAVKRLDTCWAMVDRVPGYAEMRAQIQRLCSPANDFDKYRTEVAELRESDFYIPYFPLLLKDYEKCDQQPAGDRRISRQQLAALAGVLEPITRLQTKRPHCPRIENLYSLLAIALEPRMSWDELNKQSIASELGPKLSTGMPPNEKMNEPVMRSGLEQRVLLRDIDRLCSVIFATFDINNDGVLSQSEFVHVLSNFPFLGKFIDLDADGDGLINREELRRCLLKATNVPDVHHSQNPELMEVHVVVNDDNRYYTVNIRLPDGKIHTVITRYSAVLSFYNDAKEGRLSIPSTFKFPPKHYLPCLRGRYTEQRKEAFAELFRLACSRTENFAFLVSRGFLPKTVVTGLRRKSRVLTA